MSYEGTFDVVIEGVGAERGAKVLAAPEGMYVNKHQIPYSTLLGVALRGSILLVVGTQVALAMRGARDGLAALAAELRGRADLEHLPMADREALGGERVVFATPVAMSGLVEMERFKGLALLVVTDRAMHVFERGGRSWRILWERVNKVDLVQAKFGRLLRMGSGPTQLEFLYLTDAQIQTIRGLVSRHAKGVLGVSGTSSKEREAAATPQSPKEAGESAPPAEPAASVETMPAAISPAQDLLRRFEIPEFETALGGGGGDRPLGATLERLQSSSLLPVGFLEEHLRELRTIYEGALLKVKREAAAAPDLLAAAQALDGERLREEARDRVGVMADATVRAFERQTRRIAANRRIPWRKVRAKHMPSDKEVLGLKQRLRRGLETLESTLGQVTEAARELKPAMERGASEQRAAYERWHASLRELDQAYATGWTGVSWEVIGVWQERFLPRLARLGSEKRRLLPRPLKVALYSILAAAILFVAYLALTGQISEFIQFE